MGEVRLAEVLFTELLESLAGSSHVLKAFCVFERCVDDHLHDFWRHRQQCYAIGRLWHDLRRGERGVSLKIGEDIVSCCHLLLVAMAKCCAASTYGGHHHDAMDR